MSAVVVVDSESHLPAWQQSFKGLHWADMPGRTSGGESVQKLNFALFRRGLFDPEMDVVEPEAVELKEAEEGQDLNVERTRTGKLVRRRCCRTSKSRKHGMVLGMKVIAAMRRAQSVQQPSERQMLLVRRLRAVVTCWADLGMIKRGFSSGLADSMADALGWNKAKVPTRCIQVPTMDRMEAALDFLERHQAQAAQEEVRRAGLQVDLQRRLLALRARGRTLGPLNVRISQAGGSSNQSLQRLAEGLGALSLEALERIAAGIARVEAEVASEAGRSARAPLAEDGKEAA